MRSTILDLNLKRTGKEVIFTLKTIPMVDLTWFLWI